MLIFDVQVPIGVQFCIGVTAEFDRRSVIFLKLTFINCIRNSGLEV
jgi:hypothetical protein